MKIVFFGSSDFALPSLNRLYASEHKVVAVVTQPDREQGRSMKPAPTPVKSLAIKHKTRVYQPEKINDQAFITSVKALEADVFIVVSFGSLMPQEVLEIPKMYAINLHPSLLPKYRGAAPVNWAIINGETRTGLTIIRMNERLDAGDMMLQRKVDIEKGDDAESLSGKLADLGGVLLLDALRFMEIDKIILKKQSESQKSYAPKLKKEDGLIDWNNDSGKISNLTRGLVPWPCAYTFLEEKMLKIWKAETLPLYDKRIPGSVMDARKDLLTVVCGKNLLYIKELQLEGGKRMDTATFLRGHNIEPGAFLGNEEQIAKARKIQQEREAARAAEEQKEDEVSSPDPTPNSPNQE